MFELRAPEESPFAPQMFGNAGRDHMEKYGSRPEHYVWIGWKNHKHSDEQLDPYDLGAETDCPTCPP